MRGQILAVCCWLVVASALGCGSQTENDDPKASGEDRTVKKAIAWLNPTSDSELVGSAIFINEGSQIALQVSLEQAPPGEHAVHIHENGDCSSPDGMSAGGHWNPTGEDHGAWGVAPYHLGDIGNITVAADGTGTLSLSTDRWSMGGGAENDIMEKAVVVHESADDFTTQPTGAAGSRIGCGVIRAR